MSRHRSRTFWPEPLDPADVDDLPLHSHRQPRTPWVITYACLLLMMVAVSLLTFYVVRFNDYVQGRGHYRDTEAVRMQEETTQQIRVALCDVLNGLPAGGLLDPIRAEYGCGPGVPLAQLSPDAAQQLQQFSSGLDVPTERTPAVKPRQSPPETTDAPTPTPSVAPAPVAAVPASPTTAAPVAPAPAAPSAPPLVDLTPLTAALCTGLGLCA